MLAACLASGCGETGVPAPNVPPETTLPSGPPEGGRVPNHVEFLWNGRDFDGTVRDFDYILETYRRSISSIDQIQVQVPGIGDPRWARIRANRLQLAVTADTLRADPRGDIGAGEFDRWHTFFLRAVDNEGGIDETPEARTFQAYTQAPIMTLLEPVVPGAVDTLPRTFVLNWRGTDPIGSGDDPETHPELFQDPSDTRWVLLPVTLAGGQPIGFPAALYDLPESAWTEWASWTAADSSGREAEVDSTGVPAGPAQQAFVIAVQGRDDGGAITPQFGASTPGANNYGVILVDGQLPIGPRTTVHSREDTLSAWTFDGIGAPAFTVVAATDTVTLYWDRPTGRHYGARAGESRYGWNIVDLNSDAEWTPWRTSSIGTAPPHAVVNRDRFYVQCRDQLDQVTTGLIEFLRTAAPRTAADP
jgi:hypothetical protein